MEAVRTSETSVDNHFTRQYIPEETLNIILAAVRTLNLNTSNVWLYYNMGIIRGFRFRYSRAIDEYFHILIVSTVFFKDIQTAMPVYSLAC
jgi:hypothetical protein